MKAQFISNFLDANFTVVRTAITLAGYEKLIEISRTAFDVSGNKLPKHFSIWLRADRKIVISMQLLFIQF